MRSRLASVLAAAAITLGAAGPAFGQIPDSFNPTPNGTVSVMAVQPDGKIVIGGGFTAVGQTLRSNIARINPDGSLDESFNPGANQPVRALLVQPDGKIIVGGAFTSLAGAPRSRIGRLNPDGSIDPVFDPGAQLPVLSLALEPDGQILVGGEFQKLGGGGLGVTDRKFLGRLHSNGSLDLTFDPGASAFVYTFAVQPDGRILVGGNFDTLGGGGVGTTPRRGIGRLNHDGSLDAAFDPGAMFVRSIVLQPDGRILVAGIFQFLGGGGSGSTPRKYIGRLHPDGSIDPDFNPGASALVITMAVDTAGRILVGGEFMGLGDGTGLPSRLRLGRLLPDGTVDLSFRLGANAEVQALAIQSDGRILVGGGFGAFLPEAGGFFSRARLGRVTDGTSAIESLNVTDNNSVVTWLRSGGGPEVWRTTFDSSTDGVTFTPLGTGTRIPGGWQLTGLSLPNTPALRIRARGFYGTGAWNASGSITESTAPMPLTNVITNGTFDSSLAPWLTFATPDMSYINAVMNGGVLEFYRVPPPPGTANQAVVFQQTGMPVLAGGPLAAEFDLGNSSSVRKRISVLIHDGDFTDLSVCTFWLAAGAPLTTYRMVTHTTKAWTNATLSFYAASAGSDGGAYRVDNVSIQFAPIESSTRTVCVDPTAPAPPGGAPSGNLILNGDFATNTLPPWGLFGMIQPNFNAGVFEFYRPPGTPAGVILQQTGLAFSAGEAMTAAFALGNTSGVRKRVTVLLHDADFSDLAACTFWLAPGAPRATYQMRAFPSEPWTNATLSIYAATIGTEGWTQLDNVVLQRTPAVQALGTECVEPDSPVAPWQNFGTPAQPLSGWARAVAAPTRRATEEGSRTGAVTNDGGDPSHPRWELDLRGISNVALALEVWLDAGAQGQVFVTHDGGTWRSSVVSSSSGWTPVTVDLSEFAGRIVTLTFVRNSGTESGPTSPAWWIRRVRLIARAPS